MRVVTACARHARQGGCVLCVLNEFHVYTYCTRGLHILQKKPTYIAKEAHMYCKRSLHTLRKRPTCIAQEAYMYRKRGLHVLQKRPTCIAKEAHIHGFVFTPPRNIEYRMCSLTILHTWICFQASSDFCFFESLFDLNFQFDVL